MSKFRYLLVSQYFIEASLFYFLNLPHLSV